VWITEFNWTSCTNLALDALDRFQIFNIDGCSSQRRMVNSGIPQGSVLGPLVFSFYVNEIFELPLRGKLQLYRDDAVVIYSHKEADNLFAKMQHDLNLISDWFYNNCLTFNSGKSKYVIFKDNRRNRWVLVRTSYQIT
jgi:hypothetical protein